MLYIIGIGLNVKGFSREAYDAVKNSRKAYLENYTVELPYEKEELEEAIEKKVSLADREFVESFKIVQEAKEQNVALLVYGSPLFATTHVTLIQECKKEKVQCRIVYSASVFDAVAETGLQLYKFGKIASLPNHKADSWKEIVDANKKIDAHSLILVDIGLKFEDALERMKEVANEKIVVCSRLGTDDKKIYYKKPDEFNSEKIDSPFCFVVPGKLHFLEEEVLDGFE